MTATFFATGAEFRAWLEQHHADETELLVGFYKRATGRPSMTWAESVDEALCFGWIDGVRRGIDADELLDPLHAAAEAQHVERDEHQAGGRADRGGADDAGGSCRVRGAAPTTARRSTRYEQRRAAELEPDQRARFEAEAGAWAWFQAQAPSYRRTAIHWVTSAKRAGDARAPARHADRR